jgi:hypothetical protein
MIIEKSDPEAELTATAKRIRPVLNPRQIAGVDSEGGIPSILPAARAKTMLVDFCNSERQMATRRLRSQTI